MLLTSDALVHFYYDGKPMGQCGFKESRNGGTTVYRLGSLSVTVEKQQFTPGAIYWQVKAACTGIPTGTLSKIDSISLAFQEDGAATVYRTKGTWIDGGALHDFKVDALPLKDRLDFSAEGGRSSQKDMPYFDLNSGNSGALIAVGWTGQWQAEFTRANNRIYFSAGIQDAEFYLNPGEELTLASGMLVLYNNGQAAAHNLFRALLRDNFCTFGKQNRPKQPPISVMHWGYSPDSLLLSRIDGYAKMGVEVIWVDAGWFGTPDLNSFIAFVGWVGEWKEDKRTHPDRFRSVAAEANKKNISFLLWYEMERACSIHAITAEHPDWFLKVKDDEGSPLRTFLLDLSNPEAFSYMLETLSDDIKNIPLAWYRQDFNILPLEFWRRNDQPGRAGINEIKYLNSLYKLLGTLLERFDHLMIDNCASGGSRLDIEMMKYSIPLWRSDYNSADSACLPDIVQRQMIGCSWWLPYNMCGVTPRGDDLYAMRSSYCGGLVYMTCNPDVSPDTDITGNQTVSKSIVELKRLRPIYAGDFYPLTPQSDDSDKWCAWQFERDNQGLVQVFRRENSPYSQMRLKIQNVHPGSVYAFTDIDTGNTVRYRADELEDGIICEMPQPRSARIYTYTIE